MTKTVQFFEDISKEMDLLGYVFEDRSDDSCTFSQTFVAGNNTLFLKLFIYLRIDDDTRKCALTANLALLEGDFYSLFDKRIDDEDFQSEKEALEEIVSLAKSASILEGSGYLRAELFRKVLVRSLLQYTKENRHRMSNIARLLSYIGLRVSFDKVYKLSLVMGSEERTSQ